MSPITHFLIGWSVGCLASLKKRDRANAALVSTLRNRFGEPSDPVRAQ